MPKAKNEIIQPEPRQKLTASDEGFQYGPPTIAESLKGLESAEVSYRRQLEEMSMKQKDQLNAKKKALEYKLTVALADKPPKDTTKEEAAIEFWEREKMRGLADIQRSIAYQEEQLEQMRESYERRSRSVKEKLELSKKTLSDKEAHFIEKTFQARQRLELAKSPLEPVRIRKIRSELKVIEDELFSINNKDRKRMGLELLTREGDEDEDEEEEEDNTTVATEASDVYDDDRYGDMEYPHDSGITGYKAWFKFRQERGLPINGHIR